MLARFVASDEYTEEGMPWIDRLNVDIPSVILLPGEATWIVEHAEEWAKEWRFEENAIAYLGSDRVLAALTTTEIIELIDNMWEDEGEFEAVFGEGWQAARPDVELPEWLLDEDVP